MLSIVYIQDMANKNRRERMQKLNRIKLGRYRLSRKDILVIEKLLRIYADAHEKRQASAYGDSAEPPNGRKHMPRKYTDMYVTFNGETADSIKFISKSNSRSSNFSIHCRPGMWVEFKPFSTTIGFQGLYATGIEMNTIYEVVEKIKDYIKGRRKSIINILNL